MTNEELTEYFQYLDTLRSTGATNMFGARKWLEIAFEIEGKEAGKILSLWMGSYDPKKIAEERAAECVK